MLLVGLAALAGGLIQRLLGPVAMKDAMWVVRTAQRLQAEEALRTHLTNRIAPAADLTDRDIAVAQEMHACAPSALQASKQMMPQSRADAVRVMHGPRNARAAPYLTFTSTQSAMTPAISRLFFSHIIIWPLPWMPRSASLIQSLATPAWVKNCDVHWS